MKSMIINFSGNVGKSTIAKYLLAPRLESCEIVPIESINDNEHTEKNLRGSAFGAVLDEIVMLNDNVVLDVGSSNAETIVNLLGKYNGAHEEFDIFIVPVIAKPKVINDTITTVQALSDIGVSSDKIIVMLNQVDIDTDIDFEFKRLQDQDGVFLTYDKKLAIPQHEFFTRIAGTGFDFLEVLHDETNYSKLAKETPKDDPALREYILKLALKRLATSLNKDFDIIFQSLLNKVNQDGR